MLWNGQAGYRGNGGIEVEVGDLPVVVLSFRNYSGHGKNGWHTNPTLLLSAVPFASTVGGGGSFLANVGTIVTGKNNEGVFA